MRYRISYLQKQIKAWEEFYLNYPLMDSLLDPIKHEYHILKRTLYINKNKYGTRKPLLGENCPVIEFFDPKQFVELILKQFSLEMEKIDFFFIFTITSRIVPRYKEIKNQIIHAKNANELHNNHDSFELAIEELYKELTLLEDFVYLNDNAIQHYFKKFKKYIFSFPQNFSDEDYKNLTKIFHESALNQSNSLLEENKNDIEELFNTYFSDFLDKKPAAVLKNYVNIFKHSAYQYLYLGIFIGLLIFQLLIIFTLGFHFNLDMDNDPEFNSVFPMFKGFWSFCMYMWMFAVDVYVWEKFYISYKVIFAYDNHYSEVIEHFKVAAGFTFILLFCMMLYMIKRSGIILFGDILSKIPTNSLPLICWGCLIIYYICPFKIFNYQGRSFLINYFMESVTSPLGLPEFRHSWFMAQMASMVAPMRDIEYTLCYFAYYDAPLSVKKQYCSNNRGIYLLIAYFPNMISICICLKQIIHTGKRSPQQYNIIKFTLSILTATLSFFTKSFPILWYFWFPVAFISSSYGYGWEILKDFGLFKEGKNYPLRDTLIYVRKWYYYFVMITDFFLKYLWLITISPEMLQTFIRPQTLGVILNTVEIFRRGMYNTLKVENKHIDMLNEFRVIADVELPYVKKNGKYTHNETNLMNIIKMDRDEKIQYEISNMFKGDTRKINYENNFIHEIEVNRRSKANKELENTLQKYHEETNKIILEAEEIRKKIQFTTTGGEKV